MTAPVAEYDAIIIGSGLAAFAAACALHEQNRRVAVVSRGTGASALSSGAWDMQAPDPGVFDAVERTSALLLPELEMAVRRDAPYLLPCSDGRVRKTWVVQKSQALADLHGLGKTRVGFAVSRHWRISADRVCSAWNAWASVQAVPLTFQAIDLPVAQVGWDIPLSAVANVLVHDPQAVQKLTSAIQQVSESVDRVILPPVFPHAGGGHAECLASTEPTAGYRLFHAIEAGFRRMGVDRFAVSQIQVHPRGSLLRDMTVHLQASDGWATLSAQNYILASGGVFAGGIAVGYRQVREPVFDLPVWLASAATPVGDRSEWLHSELGGLSIRADDRFRPLAGDGKPAFANLYACGAIVSAGRLGLADCVGMGRACVAAIA